MKFVLKYIDKFLKVLKTDRNTFFTYLFTLLTFYFIIDRVAEMLIMMFTGMSVSYWGPVKYTFAVFCPFFAFFLSFASKFGIGKNKAKQSFFYTHCICLYIIGISMLVQWLNHIAWVLLLWIPNYQTIIMEFSDLIRPAFSAVAIYIPLTTFYSLVTWMHKRINDPIFPNNFQESINDYQGFDINPASVPSGQYSYEISFCNERSSGKGVKILEDRRFQTSLIVGPSGCGKTSMVMEPMIAQDLEKKYFFNEVSKEMGYTALKTGIATLDRPYDNNYLNRNFRLNMLVPVEGKENIYKAYMKKMILTELSDGTIVYRNLGLTSVTPDYEHTDRILQIAKAYNIPVHLIDPKDANSPGLNPFAIKSPVLCALVIGTILKSLQYSANDTEEAAYTEQFANQAIQNLTILLKLAYPKLHDGLLPNLEDLMHCFVNFDLVEEMCEELKKDPELRETHSVPIAYFEQNFYKDAPGRADMRTYITFASSQLDYILRVAKVKDIICNRFNNLDFAEVVANGEVILFCSRATDIGGTPHKGFGRFFLFSLLIAAEDRLGNETSKLPLPHFLYIDDFEQYATPAFSDLFTIFRKLKFGTIISCQNLSAVDGNSTGSQLMQSILVNSPSKLSFGNCTPEDYAWWEKEFGERREWDVQEKYDSDKEHYSSDLGTVKWTWKNTLNVAKQQGLGNKEVVFKVKDKYGKNKVSFGRVDYVSAKYKEPHKSKTYNFNLYSGGHSIKKEEKEEKKPERFDPKKVAFEGFYPDPVQTDTTDSLAFYNNDDAIIYDLTDKKNKKPE